MAWHMVRCGVVRCGIVRCGVVCCGVYVCNGNICRVVLCCVLLCRVMSYRIALCRVVSCRVVSCRAVSCRVALLHRVLSCFVISCNANVKSCNSMQQIAMQCVIYTHVMDILSKLHHASDLLCLHEGYGLEMRLHCLPKLHVSTGRDRSRGSVDASASKAKVCVCVCVCTELPAMFRWRFIHCSSGCQSPRSSRGGLLEGRPVLRLLPHNPSSSPRPPFLLHLPQSSHFCTLQPPHPYHTTVPAQDESTPVN